MRLAPVNFIQRHYLQENVDFKEIPLPPGETPILDGNVRLYHQTRVENLPIIEREGITLKTAKGIEGPRAIYASETGFYGDPGRVPTIEFQVPKERWIDPFVVGGDVLPEEIIAVHYPWHKHVRYIEDNPTAMERALAGRFDDLTGDYVLAVQHIKAKYGTK